MHMDKLCADADKCKEKKKKNLPVGTRGCVVCACRCVACRSVGVRMQMTVKEKKRKWKERNGNLLSTNPGMQICVVCACGCVACGCVGVRTWMTVKKEKKTERKKKKTYQIQILAHGFVSRHVACACRCG